MRRFTFVLLLLVPFVLAADLPQAERLMRKSIGVVEQMADALEQAPKADDAKAKLEALVVQFRDLKKQAHQLGLEKADKERLHRQLEPDLKRALEKFLKASVKLAGRDPRGFRQLPPIFDGLTDGESFSK